MLVFDPDGRPPLGPAGNQIGWYRDTGNVETASSRVADGVTRLAQAVVLNYLALHNDVGQLGSVLPGHALGSDLDPLIGFANLPRFNT